MEVVRVRRNYQFTIPQELRKRVGLSVGDYVEVDVQGGAITIRPVKVIRKEKEAALKALKDIWEKMEGEDAEEVELLVGEAVRKVRETRAKEKE
jgi:AbrB family looped-hinge helix DNA binding protein